MTVKKSESVRIIAGLLFVLAAASEMAIYIDLWRWLGVFSVSIPMWIDMAGKVITGVVVFVGMPQLALAGSALSLLSLIVRGISNRFTVNAGFIDAEFWTSGLLWIIFWLLIAISVLPILNKKYARLVCFAAGFLELAHFGMTMAEQMTLINKYGLDFTSVCELLSILFLAVGAILLGVVLPEMYTERKNKDMAVAVPKTNTENRLVQIEKLNDLLEKKYITKEEFDAKKEQIMKS